jgi:hypothetical protein
MVSRPAAHSTPPLTLLRDVRLVWPLPQLAAGNGHAETVAALWDASGVEGLTQEQLIAQQQQRVRDEAASATASAASAGASAGGVALAGVGSPPSPWQLPHTPSCSVRSC